MRRACVAALLLLAAFAAARGAFAQVGPPLFTDDPGTPGAGNWEVNLAFTMDHTSSSGAYGTPLVDANWGWGDRIQLKLEVPWVVLSDADGTRNGVGNPLFGVKWRFLDESQAGVAVSTYPQFGFNVVRSSSEKGLVDEDPHFLLPLSAVKHLGPIELNAEVGREFRSGGEGEWVWGLAIGHEFHGFEALAEVFGTHGNAPEPGRSS